MFQSYNKYKFHFRSLFVFIASIACYFSVSIHLYLNISPHWIWSLYLSPIFVVCVFLFCLFYINIAYQHKAQSDGEEDFCITLILLTVMLIWWPIFIIIYLQIFDPILIPFEQLNSKLIQENSIKYYNEQYIQLVFQINENEHAYGCLSNQNEASVVDYPLPYKYYEIDSETLKLPSWFCGSLDQFIESKIYVSKDFQKSNYKIATFNYPNYISTSFWIAFMTTIFQFACIFSSILIIAILLIIDQKPMESNIRKPSRKRRILAFISSFTLYIFMISCNNLVITLTSLFVGVLFLFWSGFNQIHQHFYQMIRGMFKMVTHKIQYIPIAFIAILLITIYFIFVLIASQCIFHFKIFLCRHFVALWKSQNEEILEGYDEFVNKLTTLNWLWYILLIILLLTLDVSKALMIVTLILSSLQLIQMLYLLLVTQKQNFFKQQWTIYYSNYKIINQHCIESDNNQNPMELKDIELQIQLEGSK